MAVALTLIQTIDEQKSRYISRDIWNFTRYLEVFIHSFIHSTNYRGTLVRKHCPRAKRLPVKVTTHIQTTAILRMRGAILPLPHRPLSLFLGIGPKTTHRLMLQHSSHCVETFMNLRSLSTYFYVCYVSCNIQRLFS